MQIAPEHIAHAYALIQSGGYLACYTPFLEQMAVVVDCSIRSCFPKCIPTS